MSTIRIESSKIGPKEGLLNHIKSNRKYLKYGLVNALKEVKPDYGENGYALEE